MSTLRAYLFLWLSLTAGVGFAQLSPGDLTTAHAKLEGMSNCTQCHDLGNKVTNAKCLACHKDIQSLIMQKRGYHVSREVKSKDCFTCHSEHHGRKFQMVRFDEKAFDHALAGYPLEGAHKPLDCRKCHAPDKIKDPVIRSRPKTFMGLDQACLSCHADFHQGSMSKDCRSCHDMAAWKPVKKFDHAKTDFPLRGGHVQVDCKECHKVTTRNGKDFQQFADLPHADCKACHSDPHKSHFVNACAQCHTDEAFKTFIGKDRFDHNTTHFRLLGKHATTDCYQCHKKTSDPEAVFQDRLGVKENDCATCHKDPHEGKFGTECAKCHQEKGFKALRSMDRFDHAVTDFPLQGKHVGVDCKQCHKGPYTEPIAFDACMRCHEDYHKGEFARDGTSPDCLECHSLADGFEVSIYSIEQHKKTAFPLEGAHLATPCFACHMKEPPKWAFRNIGNTCTDCHENVHGDDFKNDGVTDCNRCHVADNWFPSRFDHDFTAFPLVGEHAKVDCRECHKPLAGSRLPSYRIEKFSCADCHK
ncbi:MAG TPA: hypothetical protein PKY96_17130 [Flavobacteriales bacterium]|nr:hypothetical protein [Flavobacteriales bacterium]